jgi:hypothetical protein
VGAPLTGEVGGVPALGGPVVGAADTMSPAAAILDAPAIAGVGNALPQTTGLPIETAAGNAWPPAASAAAAPLTASAGNAAGAAAPVAGVPIATDSGIATAVAPGVAAPTGGASSAAILQPVQNVASGLTDFLPLLTAPGLPGVPEGAGGAAPTGLLPLLPDTASALPGAAPLAAVPGAPAGAVETADSLSAPLSAAVPPLARGASMLLAPEALDALCPPDGVWVASAPNLSNVPDPGVPVPVQLARVVRDPE